jgi:hypothetical protein
MVLFWKLPGFSSPLVSYGNDVASIVRHRPLARFVTAVAISMKLGVRIPLSNTPRTFLFSRFDLFCGLQAAIFKITLLPFKR